MSADGSTPFWDFSLAIYGRSGVANACLRLQDRHDADVNLLLFALFAGRHGIPLDHTAVRETRAAVSQWQSQIVGPLRAVRRALKADTKGAPPDQAEALRQRLASVELAAENVEQLILAPLLPALPSQTSNSEHAAGNIKTYLDQLGARLDDDDATAIDLVIDAPFAL